MIFRALLIAFMASNYCFGQFIGARNEALANTFLTNEDILSASYNIAKLSKKKRVNIGISSKNTMLLKELQQTNLAIGFPLRLGSVAISIYNFGFIQYRESKFSIAYAFPLGPQFSIGLKFSYYRIFLKEINKNVSALTPDLGLNYKIKNKLEFGLVIAKLSFKNQSVKIWSPKIHSGIKYTINEKLHMFLETEIEIRSSISISYGLEYKANQTLSILLGVKSYPSTFSMGFSVNLNKFTLDIASSYQAFLGFSPSLSLRFESAQ